MIFISPPFGNYISLPYCKSIKGSYTNDSRPGLIKQIYNTLYFDYVLDGWVNKIGLRNKGIDYGIRNYNHNTDIISIAILNENDIETINNKLDKKMNIEINVSCPNIDKKMIDNNINKFIFFTFSSIKLNWYRMVSFNSHHHFIQWKTKYFFLLF